MSDVATMDSLRDVLQFPFHSSEWKRRFLIGVGLSLASMVIPIVPLIFVSGYRFRVLRRAVQGKKPELPPWDNWGELARDGLRMWLVGLVYLLPGILVILGGIALYFGASVAYPLMMIGQSMHTSSPEMLVPLMMMISMVIMMVAMAVAGALSLLGGIPLPMARAHVAAQDQVAAAFRVKEWGAILRGNVMSYFIGWVVVIGLLGIWYIGTMLLYYTLILSVLVFVLGPLFSLYLSWVSARKNISSRCRRPMRRKLKETGV